MLDRIATAFDQLDASPSQRAAALDAVRRWLTDEALAEYRPQLEGLIERERWSLLLDSFYRTIPFGTGGRRGPVGIGPNRINTHTIATSVQGHADYLRQRFGDTRLKVVVAFDGRVFTDLRGLGDPARPNPLLGLRSRDFARIAAEVYAANGIDVVTVSGDDRLLATPELSFAIRHLGAAAGLNVSASHNHPDDNGAKLYLETGGQPVPPEDEGMAAAVEAVMSARRLPFERALAEGRVSWWSDDGHDAYLRASLDRSLDPKARAARIVYSPLHGTGRFTVYEVLQRAGFDVALEPTQADLDGQFPAVKYRIANPEVPEAMEAVTRTMLASGADAAMASDPDADRIGLVVAHGGGSRFVSGNQIGAALAAFVLETRRANNSLPMHPLLVKTTVTTEQIAAIARHHGANVIGDLLVGFKYVAAVLDTLDREGRFGAVEARLEDFLLGVEESHGILITPAVRDKDAAGAALWLAELVAVLKRSGRTVVDYLEEIDRRYGCFVTASYAFVLEGVSGVRRIETMMEALRREPPTSIAGRAVRRVIDHADERAFGPVVSETDRASRNVVSFVLDGDMKITARPSGTEPKLKSYVDGTGPDGAARGAIAAAVDEVNLAFADHLLRSIGVELPPAAHRLSPLVSIDNRVDFASRFLPELRARLDARESLEPWIDERLQSYGKDARSLVVAGIAAAAEDPLLRPHAALLRRLFGG